MSAPTTGTVAEPPPHRSRTVDRWWLPVRAVLDLAVVDKVRAGRLRDEGWPYGLRAVVGVGVVLFALAGVLALVSGPIRAGSTLAVPNSLTSSVPDTIVWALVLLLTFCLALLTTAALHGPWWLLTLGLLASTLLMGIWSTATVIGGGPTLATVLAAITIVLLVVLAILRRRRGLAWWEFPLVLALLGAVISRCVLDFTGSQLVLGFRLAPVFVDQTSTLLTFLVLPAAFAAGAAVAEIAVAITMAATRIAQRRATRHWPYAVLAGAVVLRLAQETRRLIDLDPVGSGWLAVVPALAVVAGFAGLGWLLSRWTPIRAVPVADLAEQLSRVAVPVGAALIAVLLPVHLLLLGFQVVFSVSPSTAPAGFDPSPVVDRLVDGVRAALGVGMIGLALALARRGRGSLALVLGAIGVMVLAVAIRLLTGYRWSFWLDPDALVSVVTVGILLVAGWLLGRRRLSADRALGLAAVLALAVLLSLRSVVSDPFAALLGYTGVAFVLFGVVWDFLTGSDWANTDGRHLRRPVRVLLALGYPLLTVTVLASDALIRRPRTTSDLNAFASLGELLLGTALLAAAATVVLAAVRADRPVV